jgi:tetratricopeptide (TPR) repeat protein
VGRISIHRGEAHHDGSGPCVSNVKMSKIETGNANQADPIEVLIMRWPRPRFTVRRIMVAVAVLALFLGGSLEVIRLKRFRDECLKRAATHAESERYSLEMEQHDRQWAERIEGSFGTTQRFLASLEGTLSRASARLKPTIVDQQKRFTEAAEQEKRDAAKWRGDATRDAESAAYHGALKRKYLRAAARPWWPIEPDPPPPELEARGPYWSARGEYRRALAAYEEALQDDPERHGALNDLAWLVATCPEATLRDGKRAVELASRACRITNFAHESYVDTLAAAHAEAGDFQTAVELQRKAIGMLSPGDPNAESYRVRLDGYRANKPYRQRVNGTE